MAFGVVVAGTGALSGMGGQKRYRVNRFRREIYCFVGSPGMELPRKAAWYGLRAIPSQYTYVCAVHCCSFKVFVAPFRYLIRSVFLPIVITPPRLFPPVCILIFSLRHEFVRKKFTLRCSGIRMGDPITFGCVRTLLDTVKTPHGGGTRFFRSDFYVFL